jgi:signal transduction histidine kinase
MSRSIQSRLTIALTATAIVLSASVGIMLYRVIGAGMVQNFDRGLRAKGQAVVSLVSLESGGVLDFEFNEAAMPEYRPGKHAEYFQIRFADGTLYSRAKSLGDADLQFGIGSIKTDSFYDLPLPDGRPGRAVRIDFVPQSEQPPPIAPKPMAAVIARGRAELDENLLRLVRSLISAALVLGTTTAITSSWIVRHSLRSLRGVALQAAAIEATKLNVRLNERGLPAELVPICGRLNDLLARLEAAFAREQRFTADVSHELRTPVAELRAIAEVALKCADDPNAAHEALRDAKDIAMQMETLINTLMSLVRCGHQSSPISLQSIRLAELVERTVAGFRSQSNLRAIEVSVPASIEVRGEPTLLASVLNNLFANALEYAVGNSPVRCFVTQTQNECCLYVENQAVRITSENMPLMFEPFWRSDASRTGSIHAGLGLALVRTYCRLMDIDVVANMVQANVLSMRLSIPMANLTRSRSAELARLIPQCEAESSMEAAPPLATDS